MDIQYYQTVTQQRHMQDEKVCAYCGKPDTNHHQCESAKKFDKAFAMIFGAKNERAS